MDGTVSRKLLVALALGGMLVSLSMTGCGPQTKGHETFEADDTFVSHASAFGYVNTLFTVCHNGNRIYYATKGGVAFAGPCEREVTR